MMPVEGDSSAPSQASAGSRARASSPRQHLHVGDAVGLGMCLDGGELGHLLRPRRDDQLAAIAMRDAAAAAVVVELVLAGDAELRHQAAGGIIDAGMDHLTVARGGDGADGVGSFQHDDFAARFRQSAGDGEANDAGADDDAFNPVHPFPVPFCCSAQLAKH